MPLPQITLTGRLVADPNLRVTPNGKALVNFTVAANDRVKTPNGWEDGNACFLDCTAWAAKAEAIADQLRKGSLVTVTGRLEQQSWEAEDGSRRSKHAVKVDEVAAVVLARNSSTPSSAPTQSDPWAAQPASAPF